MKIEDIPFNMNFHYDEELKEYAEDFEQMEKGVDFLKERFDQIEEDNNESLTLMIQMASFLRILRQWPEAEQYLVQALEIAKNKELENIEMAINLRLAIIYQSQRSFNKANETYKSCLKKIKESKNKSVNSLLDFAYFHLGQCRFQEGLKAEAMDLITKSLEMRLLRGDVGIIEHTQQAIQVVNNSLQES